MKRDKITRYFMLKHFIFWILMFSLFKLIFFFKVFYSGENLPLFEWIHILQNGFFLDLSMAAYLAILPFIVYLISRITANKTVFTWAHRIQYLQISLVIFVLLTNIQLYEHWHCIINNRALSYLTQPMLALASLSSMEIGSSLLSYGVCIWLFNNVYIFLLHYSLNIRIPLFSSNYFLCIWLLIIPITIRGGFQHLPINESDAMYSKIEVLNHISCNPVWYLMNDVLKSKKGIHAFAYSDNDLNDAAFKKLMAPSSTEFEQFIQTSSKKINILILIQEGLSASVIAELGGEKGICTSFSELSKEGVLFTNIYSSGFRTDQGLAAILSGFPAQPKTSVVKDTQKAAHLPLLTNSFSSNGYHTLFLYGGDIEFANIKPYILRGFHEVISKEKIKVEGPKGKWGYHDEVIYSLLNERLSSLTKTQTPFFASILTLSNHDPYDIDVDFFPKDSKANKYRNSAAYSDRQLGKFIQDAKNQEWYEHTLIIIVADHGHAQPEGKSVHTAKGRHIPMLWLGGALKKSYRGKRIDTYGGHHDLPASILSQLSIPSEKFNFSRNLGSKDSMNAAIIVADAYSLWVNAQGEQRFDYGSQDQKTDSLPPKIFLQKLLTSYDSLDLIEIK